MASVVIHRYLKVAGGGVGKAKAHVKYIQHRRGEDKERPVEDRTGPKRRELFDGERDSLDRRELNDLIDRERQSGGMTRHKVAIHKLTLSPGIQGVDLKEYTREVMDELSREKGLDLQWAAAAHRNTDHDHVHVVILGSDANERKVLIGKDDHDLLRDRCDRYLEREHAYDRHLERETREVERILEERGDSREQDRLGILLGKGRTFEEHKQEKEREPWSKEQAIEALSERDKITVQERTYTKFDNTDDLKALNEHIKTHYEDRIDKQQYAMLNRWVETKERSGDDCFERWDRQRHDKRENDKESRDAHREWHELDKNARHFLEKQEFVIHRHMPHQQRIFEERGRMLEFHATYMNSMAKQHLMEARERTENPEVLKYIDKELEQLKEFGQELAREMPTIDLDKLYGKDAERSREREPERALNLDEIRFSDPFKEKADDREQSLEAVGQKEPDELTKLLQPDERATETQEAQRMAREAQEQAQQLGEREGQDIHEQTIFKSKLDDREDDEREHEDRER